MWIFSSSIKKKPARYVQEKLEVLICAPIYVAQNVSIPNIKLKGNVPPVGHPLKCPP